MLNGGESGIDVLMVDDDPEFCDLISHGLESNNETMRVETTNTPDSGLAIIDERPPDCVVSDYNMPGMNGIELLEAVRQDHPEIPYILYTNRGNENIAAEAISAGITDYLVKGHGAEHYNHLSSLIQATVQKYRKEQLNQKEQKMVSLAEIASDAGGFEVHIDTDTLVVTEGALRILDPSREATLTQLRLEELFAADDQTVIKNTAERTLSTGEDESITVSYQRSDNDRRVLQLSFISPVAERGVTAVRGVIKDTTDREEKQRQIDVFDRVLRHNLRNNLNLIGGTAETIASRATGEIAEYSQQIIEKSDRLLKTISIQRDIMAVLRNDPQYETIDIDRALQRVAAEMSNSYTEADLTVDSHTDLSVEASTHLMRAVRELIKNAIEHNDARPAAVWLTAEHTDDGVCVQIADNGPSIPDMERDVLVEPRERTPLYHGSGLGLWFVKLIVFRSNGEIRFDENDPNGNIIRIIIPE